MPYMNNLERAGEMSSRRRLEHPGDAVDSPPVQAALMLFVYRAMHSLPDVDVTNAQRNSAEIQADAALEWIGDIHDPHSLAALYRSYVSSHPHERVDLQNEGDLERLLANIRDTSTEQRH